MSEWLTIYGTIYIAISLVGAVTFLVLATQKQPRIGPINLGPEDKHVQADIARLLQLGYADHEIARFVAYRQAVRAGYFTDWLHEATGVRPAG